jgi:segregation and condensation protein A
MDVAVKLDIFEGPLDLLLHLIRKNEVDIYDIPIALITRQYLGYLDMMRELNISLAGEFLVMASTLTHIKSRTLLPSYDKEDDEAEEEDPRFDLVQQLKEHMRFKAAAEALGGRPQLEHDVFTRFGGRKEVDEAVDQAAGEEVFEVGVFDLIEAFRSLLKSKGERLSLAIPSSGISIEDRMTQLLEILRQKDTVTFEDFFAADRTRGDLVVTFLAILELTRVGLLRAYQDRVAPADGSKAAWGTLRIYFNVLSREEGEEL